MDTHILIKQGWTIASDQTSAHKTFRFTNFASAVGWMASLVEQIDTLNLTTLVSRYMFLGQLWARSLLGRLAKNALRTGTNDPLVSSLETHIQGVGWINHFPDIGTTSRILCP